MMVVLEMCNGMLRELISAVPYCQVLRYNLAFLCGQKT